MSAHGSGSAAPAGLGPCRTVYEMAIVVATMNLVALVAEEANMVRLAEGALMPSWVDVPAAPAPAPAARAVAGQLASPAAPAPTGWLASTPSTIAAVHGGPTLYESPNLSAATHTSVAIAEVAGPMTGAEVGSPMVE